MMARNVPYSNKMLTGRKQARPIDDFDDDLSSSSQGWPVLSLVRILWKRKKHVLLTWAGLSAVAVAVVMLWPATYRAETLILVDSQKIPEKFVSATVNVELQDRLATISQRILSSTRLQKIIEASNLYEKERKSRVQEEIVEMMRGDIKVTPEKGWIQNRPGAFRVSYEGRNPSTVANVANQLGNLFIDENLHSRETIAEGTSNFMKSQLEQAKKNLEEQEQKMSQFKQAYNGELPQQETSLAQELSRLQLQLQGNQDALNRANQNQITLESALNVAQSTEATLKRLIETASGINGRVAPPGTPGAPPKKRSEQLEDELAQALLRYKPNYSPVRALKAELERVKAQEAKEEADAAAARAKIADAAKNDKDGKGKNAANGQDLMPGSPEAVRALSSERERIALLNAQLTTVGIELKSRQEDQKKILAQIEAVQARLRRLPLREQEMAQVTRDYEMSKANYKSLEEKIFAADMASEMEHNQKSERFMVLDSARVPEKPVSPNRPLFAGLAGAVSLILSLGFWLFCDIRKNKLMGEWELPEGAVVLGRVPNLLVAGAAGGGILSRRLVAVSAVVVAVLGIASVAAYMILVGH